MPGVREQIKIRPPGRVMMQLNRDVVQETASWRLRMVKNLGGRGHGKAPEMRTTRNKEAFVTAVGKDRKREQRGDTLDQQSPGGHFKDFCL